MGSGWDDWVLKVILFLKVERQALDGILGKLLYSLIPCHPPPRDPDLSSPRFGSGTGPDLWPMADAVNGQVA